MVAESASRVTEHTSQWVNEHIRRETERRVAYFETHPQEIDARLRELNSEWDLERVLATGSSTLTLTGLLLALGINRKWLILSLGVQAFYMQHALEGWCPPLPLFRALGVRTQYEIEQERYALKAIRGDFAEAAGADEALQAART